MNFNKVEFDTELEQLDADELRELVGKFTEAQTENLETFEDAADRVREFEEYNEELTEELVEASPLTEAEVESTSFSRKRELLDEFSDEQAQESGEGPNSFGQRGNTHGEEENNTPELVEQAFDNISGVEL
jgi:hypothetical protein